MGNGAALRRQCSRPSSTLHKWIFGPVWRWHLSANPLSDPLSETGKPGGSNSARVETKETQPRLHSHRSILRGLVQVIDNEDVHWPLCRFEAESELLLKS